MKLTNIGGATAILEHDGVRMMFDPWMDDGIFHGAWYHYPPLQMAIEDVGPLDYIYISHIHEDHCSAGTLERLDKDAELIIMDRRPNFVAKFLDRQGFGFAKTHLVPPETPTRLTEGLTVDMVTADPEHALNFTIDSGLILSWDGWTIYNANDCPPYKGGMQYILDTYGRPDLALLPYAGGSGYPACYTNLNHDEKMAEKERIRAEGYEMFLSATKVLSPRFVMPFADQYVVGGSRRHLNQYMPHPPCPGAVQPLFEGTDVDSELLLLTSGQSFDLADRSKRPPTEYQTFSDADRDQYVDSRLADVVYEHEEAHDPVDDLLPMIRAARRRLARNQDQAGWRPEASIVVATDQGRQFEIRLQDDHVIADGTEPSQPFLRVSGPERLMSRLLTGEVSWNIADAALFIDYKRVPNVYDPQMYVMLNHLRA